MYVVWLVIVVRLASVHHVLLMHLADQADLARFCTSRMAAGKTLSCVLTAAKQTSLRNLDKTGFSAQQTNDTRRSIIR
jgi:hypothetical protein